jgi:hypothetical protein
MSESFSIILFLNSLNQEEIKDYESVKRFLKLEKKLFNAILTKPKVKIIFNFSNQDGVYSILAMIEAMDFILNEFEVEIYNKSKSQDFLTLYYNEKSLILDSLNYDENSEYFSNIQLKIYEFLR